MAIRVCCKRIQRKSSSTCCKKFESRMMLQKHGIRIRGDSSGSRACLLARCQNPGLNKKWAAMHRSVQRRLKRELNLTPGESYKSSPQQRVISFERPRQPMSKVSGPERTSHADVTVCDNSSPELEKKSPVLISHDLCRILPGVSESASSTLCPPYLRLFPP
jgi:hypothetical protein